MHCCASLTEGALVLCRDCALWAHYDVTETYRALRNNLVVHWKNGTMHKPERNPRTMWGDGESWASIDKYAGDFDAILFINRYGINPYLYSGCYGPGAILGILNKGSGFRPSGSTWNVTSTRLTGDVKDVWINRSWSNPWISHFKVPLAQLFTFQHLIFTN